MDKIVPCIWFDTQALEAAELYTSVFPNSSIECTTHYLDDNQMPAGTVLTVRFNLCGRDFSALNGGTYYSANPSISFFVSCTSKEELEMIYSKLSCGGTVLMEMAEYPFSPLYVWFSDKYGVSWQLSLDNNSQSIAIFMLFCGQAAGKANEAIDFYCTIFNNSEKIDVQLNTEADFDPAGTVKHAIFSLSGREFHAIDSFAPHAFTFSEGLSLCIYCSDQSEIDYFWDQLTEGGEESQCGWLKDKFGVSWQIVNEELERMMSDAHPEKTRKMNEALFSMRKLDLAALKDAYNN